MAAVHDREDFIFHEDFSAYSTGNLRETNSLRDHAAHGNREMSEISGRGVCARNFVRPLTPGRKQGPGRSGVQRKCRPRRGRTGQGLPTDQRNVGLEEAARDKACRATGEMSAPLGAAGMGLPWGCVKRGRGGVSRARGYGGVPRAAQSGQRFSWRDCARGHPPPPRPTQTRVFEFRGFRP